jgi:hypothetical protein
MYHYNDKELVEKINSHINNSSPCSFFWFRDMVEDAVIRGLVIVNEGLNPFWWHLETVVITEKGKLVLEGGRR